MITMSDIKNIKKPIDTHSIKEIELILKNRGITQDEFALMVGVLKKEMLIYLE